MTGQTWEVHRVRALPRESFDALLEESRREGFLFHGRLAEDWRSGANRFDARDEGFYEARGFRRAVAEASATHVRELERGASAFPEAEST